MKIRLTENELKQLIKEEVLKTISANDVAGIPSTDEEDGFEYNDIPDELLAEPEEPITDDNVEDYQYALVSEGVDEMATVQGGNFNDKELNYTHFAVNKKTNLIINGWNYSDYDSEELKSDKKYFSMMI